MTEISLTVNGKVSSYNGDEIDVGDLSTDQQIISALSRETGEDLDGFTVDRLDDGLIKVRPQASFG